MSVYGLTYEDHRRLAASFENIRQTAPAKLVRKDARLHERTMELRVVGTTAEWFDLVPREVLAGRLLMRADEEKRAPVVILTEFGARKLLATQSTIGQTLRIGGNEFEIIGIIKSESGQAGNIQIPDQETDAYISLEVARRYYGDIFARMTSGSFERERVELHQIIIQVDDPKHVEAVAAGIENMLMLFHKKKDYIMSVPLALLKQTEATKRTFNIVLGSIAGHQPARRRHRYHEHHAGLGHRADAGDRHPPGHRGQAQADHLPVPHRDGRALDDRRPDRPGAGRPDPAADHALLRHADGRHGQRHLPAAVSSVWPSELSSGSIRPCTPPRSIRSSPCATNERDLLFMIYDL